MSLTTAFRTDRRPALVICAYDRSGVGWDPGSGLSGETWNPVGARAVIVPSDEPHALARTLSNQLIDPDCRGLLLLGHAERGKGFQVQMRAENRALDGGGKLSTTGPAIARSTAPVAEILRALQEAGLDAAATSEGREDVGSYLLYSILTRLPDDVDAPAVGLLRVPAHASPSDLDQGVRLAATAIARHLSPLPRTLAG
jgi:hypothetical protein